MVQNKSKECPNCNTELLKEENFCPVCGQKNTDLNISVLEVIKDFSGDYFTFDSKFLTTIGPLIFIPGKVPSEYIEGKRVSHIPPLRAFIFLSFITFFLWGFSFDRSFSVETPIEDVELATPVDTISEKTVMEETQSLIDSLNEANAINIVLNDDSVLSDTNLSSSLDYVFDKSNDPKIVADSLIGDSNQVIKHFVYQSLRMYHAEDGVAANYFLGNLSIVLLLLQPFFALLLKLFYIRRKSFFYIEHLVFSLYFHSFILITTILLFFLSFYFDPDYLILWLILISIIYLYLAIKRFYNQSWGKSFVKCGAISFIYMTLILPTFMLGYFLLSLYFY